jgi:hypothetical protein
VTAPLPPGAIPEGFPAAQRAPALPRTQNPPAVAANPPKPLVRAQMDDSPKTAAPHRPVEAKLAMPSPEQLGIRERASEAAVDWTAIRRRFRDAGATCLQIEDRPGGGCRLTCLLPSDQPNRTHRIDAEAPTEGEAARLALDRLEEWTRKK